jgi:hypothetical protein
VIRTVALLTGAADPWEQCAAHDDHSEHSDDRRALVERLSVKIRWRKSAAGRPALMTAKLRDYIKTRDGT